jgi:hypothetical protein
MEKLLNELVERLKKAYGDRLISVVLYGSAADGDYHRKFSDLNVLSILNEVTPDELAGAESIFRWWRGHGNPSPLLLSEAEAASSSHAFPIEFRDIQRSHRVLYGKEVVAGAAADCSFYRVQVGHELRARLLRLRQKAAGIFSDNDLLRRLLADSVSTFCVLFRHALALLGEEPPPSKREVMLRVQERFGVDPQPFQTLLDLREQRIKPPEVDPANLLEAYLRGISAVVEAVERLET